MTTDGDGPRIEDLLGEIKRTIHKIIKKHGIRNRAMIEEAFQEGFIGALEAYERFDPARNVKFTSFARGYIQGKIYDYLYQQNQQELILTPDSTDKDFVDVDEMIENAAKRIVAGRQGTSKRRLENNLSEGSEEEKNKISKAIEREKKNLGSMKSEIAHYFHSSTDLANSGEEKIKYEKEIRVLRECLNELESRVYKIIQYLFYYNKVAKQVAHEFDISQGRLSQLKRQGLYSLRQCLIRKGYET